MVKGSGPSVAGPTLVTAEFQGVAHCVGEAGNIWSFNFFLYNRKAKRMLYFSCRGVSKSVGSSDSSDYNYNRCAGFLRARRGCLRMQQDAERDALQ